MPTKLVREMVASGEIEKVSVCLTGEDADVVAVAHGAHQLPRVLEDRILGRVGAEDLVKLELLLLAVLRVEDNQLARHDIRDDRLLARLSLHRDEGTGAAEDSDVALELLDGVVQRALFEVVGGDPRVLLLQLRPELRPDLLRHLRRHLRLDLVDHALDHRRKVLEHALLHLGRHL